jgi:hypothetical protein
MDPNVVIGQGMSQRVVIFFFSNASLIPFFFGVFSPNSGIPESSFAPSYPRMSLSGNVAVDAAVLAG